jgi:hypothetical protein
LQNVPSHSVLSTGQGTPFGDQYLHGLPFAMTSRT